MSVTITKMDKARSQLVLDHPFFASLVLRKPMIETDQVQTAAVNAHGQIFYNPKFVDKLDVQQIVFLLAHEVGHVIADHCTRRGSRDPKKWNIAGDAWINDMLQDAGVGRFIDGGVNMPGSKDKTTDQIYNELPDQPGGGGGQQQGPGGIGDDIIEDDGNGNQMSKEQVEQARAEMKVAIAQAAQAAKMLGKMPGKLAEIVADIIHVKTPWYDILERYMVAMTQGEYTWLRPNRRFTSMGHYLPSTGSVAQMGEIALVIDISGSISKQEIDHYNGHLQRIIELCRPEKVHLLYTDTQVQHYEVFEQGQEVQINFYSGGGTDMEAAFDYLSEQGVNTDCVVVLTDGYTSFDDNRAPDCPVLWCISTKVEAPYGETIHFDME